MNTKLKRIVPGELGTPAVDDILNELIGIAQRLGHIKVANKTGNTLAAGTLIAFDGYDATLAALTVVKADARPSRLADAVLSESIPTDHAGIVYTAGVVGGLVADEVVGTKVYLSATAGEFAFTAPSDPGDAVQLVGVVRVRSATAGSILFFPGAAAPGSIEDAYVLPATGIPAADMATAVQTSLGKADTAYQKPGGGIPSADLANDLKSAVTLTGQVISGLGGLFLKFDDVADGSSAATVKAAAVGAKTKTLHVALVDGNDVTQTWYAGPMTLTPAKTVVDTDVGLPTVTGGNTVQLAAGIATFILVYDTDANVTKSYVATDEVGVTAAIADVFGETVDVTDAVFLDTLIA